MSAGLVLALKEHAVTSADNLNYHSGAHFRKEEMIEWKAAVRIERLQAVVDVAKEINDYFLDATDDLPDAMIVLLAKLERALDGEPCQTCGGGVTLSFYCPDCHGTGRRP